jgi:WD40 repeat protein
MDRRQFHQTVTATAAALVVGGKIPNTTAAIHAPTIIDPLPPGAAMRLGSNRLWHLWPASNTGLNDLCFSPDGQYLATLGYQDDHVFIWSIPEGLAVSDWEAGNSGRSGTLFWTCQGLYISCYSGLSLWEPLTATRLHQFTGDPTYGLGVSADGRYIAAETTNYRDQWIGIWDTRTRLPVMRLSVGSGEVAGTFSEPMSFLTAVAFSRCGRWLAVGGYTHARDGKHAGLVDFWDLTTQRHLIQFPAHSSPIRRMAFTPTGQLLTAHWSGTIAVWDPVTGGPVCDWPRPQTGNVYQSLAANAAGQIALQREDGVRLWHPDPSRETLLCPALGFCHLAFSDDSRFVAASGHTGRVDLYDARSGADISPPDRHSPHIRSIDIPNDGKVCLVCSISSDAYTAEVVLRETLTATRVGCTPPPGWWPLALAPVGSRVAGKFTNSQLAVWDWASGEVAVHPKIEAELAAWSPDGETLLVATKERAFMSWNLRTGKVARQPISDLAPVRNVALAANGRAAALSATGELFVWQLDRDELPRRIAVPIAPAEPRDSLACLLALAPDGGSVAVGDSNGVVYVGSVSDDELRPTHTHPPGPEGGEDGRSVVLRYTLVGQLLIAGVCSKPEGRGWRYTTVVTDGHSGKVLWQSEPSVLYPSPLELSPDGRLLLTGSEDGTVLVWPLNPGA